MVVVGMVVLAAACSSSESATQTEPAPAAPPASDSVALVPSNSNAAPTSEPAPPPPDGVPTNAADEPVVVTLGQSPEGRDYWIRYERERGVPNGTFFVDNGEIVPAVLDPTRSFPRVTELVFGPDGLVAFASGHYNYGPLVFVGRTDADGYIRDLHRVGGGLYGDDRPLTSGAFDETGVFASGDYRLDTKSDPMFVMTADQDRKSVV